jgi:hypothetical protein
LFRKEGSVEFRINILRAYEKGNFVYSVEDIDYLLGMF